MDVQKKDDKKLDSGVKKDALKPMDKPIEQHNTNTAATPQNPPRVFIIAAGLRNAIINLIGAGSYNATPPVPARDVTNIANAVAALKPFNLSQEQPSNAPSAAPIRPVQVFLMDENLRNVVVNLLGAGTFNHIPVMEVIRVINVLRAAQPFDITVNKDVAKTDTALGVKKDEIKNEKLISKTDDGKFH